MKSIVTALSAGALVVCLSSCSWLMEKYSQE